MCFVFHVQAFYEIKVKTIFPCFLIVLLRHTKQISKNVANASFNNPFKIRFYRDKYLYKSVLFYFKLKKINSSLVTLKYNDIAES